MLTSTFVLVFDFMLMKKKLLIILAVICAIVSAVFIVGSITGMLLYNKVPSPANEPNIQTGSWVFSSNLIKPESGNFIVFTSDLADSLNAIGREYEAGSRYLYRLCGVPGNVLQMKNSVLFVNNINFDGALILNNAYKISVKDFYLIDAKEVEQLEMMGGIHFISDDTAMVVFDNTLVNKYGPRFKLTPFVITETSTHAFKWLENEKDWTPDNFGPLKIPADCYFVLGDNRHNALDSRYIGYIKKENIKGVVLNK